MAQALTVSVINLPFFSCGVLLKHTCYYAHGVFKRKPVQRYKWAVEAGCKTELSVTETNIR